MADGQRSGSGGGPGAGRLDLEVGQPSEPSRQVPAAVAEEAQGAGENDHADERGIQQQSGGDAEAHLLEHDELPAGEAAEHHDDDKGGPGDDPGGGRDSVGDRLAGGAGLVIALLDPAHQEYLVVHGQGEQDREEEQGHPGVDGGHLLEPEDARADPVQEYEGQEPVSGADREQVEHDRQAGHDHGPEREGQQQEAQPEHEDQHIRGGSADGMEVIGCISGLAAHIDRRGGAGEGGWDQVLAQVRHGGDVTAGHRVAPDGHGQRQHVTAGRGLDGPGPEARVSGQPRLQPGQVGVVGAAAALGDDLDRVGVLARKVPGDGQIALLGGQRAGQGGDAALADVQAEHRDRGEEHEAADDGEADDRAADDPGDHGPPEASLSGVGPAHTGSDEGYPQGVDAVAEQAEDCGKQRESGGDRHDADDDGARSQAAQDVGRHQEEAEQRDHEGRAAEEYGPAGGRGGHRDGGVLIEPAGAFLPETGDDEERVVDAERQAHAGHHVDDEDRQAELLGNDGGDPEADDDRHQGHEHRHESGDHGPEHEHQDDDGDRQPEVDLAVAQVAGG